LKKWIVIGIILLVLVGLMAITKTLMFGGAVVILLALIALMVLAAFFVGWLGTLGSILIKSVAGIESWGWCMILGIPLAMIFGYLIYILTGTFLDQNGPLIPTSIFSAIIFYIGYVDGLREN